MSLIHKEWSPIHKKGPQGSGKAPLVVLRCFQWIKDVPWDPQSIARCSQQVTRCSQGDGRCSQGAGMCVICVQKVFNGVFYNIYSAVEVISKAPKVLEVPNMIPTSHKVFPRLWEVLSRGWNVCKRKLKGVKWCFS